MKPKMRLTDAELELFKTFFAEQDGLLLTIRNAFFGFELSEDEKQALTKVMTPALTRLLRKQFLPEFQPDIPVGQNIDMYMLADIKGKTKEQIYQEVEATQAKIELIEIGLKRLSDPRGVAIDTLKFTRNDYETDLAGRNLFVNHIDRQLQTIEVLAGQMKETVEETKKRLSKDNTK